MVWAMQCASIAQAKSHTLTALTTTIFRPPPLISVSFYKQPRITMEQPDIQTLIHQSCNGDTQAFALLVKQYQSLVFRLAFRLLCDEEEAKDMLQEVFVKVWLSLNKYNPTYKFSTWVYSITANTCYDRLRTMQYAPESYKADMEIGVLNIASGETTDRRLVNEELKAVILHFTAELTPKQKLVFTLRDLEELEIDEIETITGLSPAKIKSNLYLARKYIREKINKTDYRS